MNSCPNKEKLSAYKLGLLNRIEMGEIEEHIEHCAECRQELKLETMIEDTLSNTMNAGGIESMVMRRVRALQEMPFPSTVFKGGFWRLISYTLAAIGVAYALLIYLGKSIVLERVMIWLMKVADILGSISPSNTWMITFASVGLSLTILVLFYAHKHSMDP